MANSDTRPFAINGAGIAGLTTALALAANNQKVMVFEKAEGFEMLGAGIQLSPNAMHVLDDLGLSRWIDQAASEPDTIDIENGVTGNKLASLPLGQKLKDKFGAPYKVIHRADLLNILFNACKNNPYIDLHFSSQAIEMAPHGNGVTVMLEQNGEVSEQQVAGLVIADGVWSQLRTKVVGLEAPQYTGKIAWRALIPSDGSEQTNSTRVWFGPKSHVVSYPVRSGNYQNLVIITDGPESSGKETITIGAEELRANFGRWKGSFLPLLERKARWTGWPLFETPKIDRMAYGSVVLIGDAAHAMVPFAAQGAAMAIEDAAELAFQVKQHKGVDDAFKEFEKKRIPRVARVSKTAQANGSIYHLSGIRSDLRDLGMWLTPTSILSARQNWIYGWRLK